MQRNKRERKATPIFEAGQGGGLATSSKAAGSKANEGAKEGVIEHGNASGSDDDNNWVPTKRGKKVAAKKVAASKAAATQEEKSALRRIRAKRAEHVNLLAKQLQEEANNEDADDQPIFLCLYQNF